MSKSTEPKPRQPIEDPSIAWEVAHSAKDERSVAAAKRLVDGMATEFNDAEGTDFENHSELTAKIMGAHAIYPEVFRMLFHSNNKADGLKPRELAEAISDIAERGELSLHNIVGWDNEGSANRFDKKADSIENATEALLVHPPTQDFLRDFELGHNTYLGSKAKGYEYRVTVKDIVGLISWSESFDKQYQAAASEFQHMLERYERLDITDKTTNKLQSMLSMLDRINSHMIITDKTFREEFESQVLAAKNSEETTIADFKALYINASEKLLELLKDGRDGMLSTYNAAISGEASRYGIPEVDTTETAE